MNAVNREFVYIGNSSLGAKLAKFDCQAISYLLLTAVDFPVHDKSKWLLKREEGIVHPLASGWTIQLPFLLQAADGTVDRSVGRLVGQSATSSSSTVSKRKRIFLDKDIPDARTP